MNHDTLSRSGELNVYIILPFCAKKRRAENDMIRTGSRETKKVYLAALKKEAMSIGDILEKRVVKNIFVGGGAAAGVLPDKLAGLLSEFTKSYTMSPDLELTLTATPDSLSDNVLSSLMQCGFNQLSLEALSATEPVLKWLETSYNLDDISNCLITLEKFRIAGVNVDVMYGIPNQTPNMIKKALSVFTQSPCVTHISMLPFEQSTQTGVTGQIRRQQHLAAVEFLTELGFDHYASGHFAKPSKQFRFALGEFRCMDRLGLGLGARSYIDEYSYQNTLNFGVYMNDSGDYTKITTDVSVQSDASRQRRFVSFGLRLAEGFAETDFKDAFDRAPDDVFSAAFDEMSKQKLIINQNGRIKPTLDGLLAPEIIDGIIYTATPGDSDGQTEVIL